MTKTVTARAGTAPVCEALEKRALLAGNTVVEAGILTVYGSDGDDAITVTVDAASASTVSVSINGADAGTFSGLSGVRVSGRGGNDLVQVSDSMSSNLGTTLVGGDGMDTLAGGNGIDNLFGSAGDDLLMGGENDDNLVGGLGVDTFNGGGGFNFLSADSVDEVTELGGGFDIATDLADDPGFALDPAPEPEPEPEPTPEPVCDKPGLRLGHYKNGKLCTTPPAAGCFKKVA